MVSITKKKVKGIEYYYLSYSYRETGNVKLIEKSLGRVIPTDLNQIKETFIFNIVTKRWLSKIELIKKKYESKIKNLPKVIKQKIFKDFGISFTYNSNKIEGSTLTLRETALVINEKNVPINKSTNDINVAQGHMLCYEDVLSNDSELKMDLIIDWHKTLFSFHPSKKEFAGVIREENIFISGSDYIPPSPKFLEALLKELFIWYNKMKNTINPVLLACLMKYRFVSIHPFLDGNGRMSRLLMNYILYKNNYPMFNISANIRKTYYKALEKSNLGFDLKGDEMIFVGWFFKNYINELNKHPYY